MKQKLILVHKAARKLTLTKLFRLHTDSIIVLLITSAPLVFYSYTCFPDVKIWETRFFTFESHYYKSVYAFMWTFLQKFVWLYLMLIWYLTNDKWWNGVLLIPIGMLLFQCIMMVNEDVIEKDEIRFDKYFVIPLVVGICYILFRIRKKIIIKIKRLDLINTLQTAIKKIETDEEHQKRDS